ncbi:molybdopterin-dependent oxidoreductase [Sessilibacter sp. MAH4]
MTFLSSSTDNWIKTTCAYCGVGCGVEAKVEEQIPGGDLIVKVRGDDTHPANFGRLCSKGLALGETAIANGRLLHPNVDGQDTTWEIALNEVATRFKETIETHGPDSVAFYVSGQILTEDYYLANKLMKGFIGSGNIDTNSRLCMSSSVSGHKRAFGSDTVPNVYTDFELSDLVILVGSNLAWCHPVLFQRLKAAKAQRPEMKVVVIDPRATDSCAIADLHLAVNPGTDVALFNGLLAELSRREIIDSNYVDQYTEGFEDALAAAQRDCQDHNQFLETLGVDNESLQTFYDWFATTEKTFTVYSQGVNQSSAGVDKVNAIINCHFATGRIGKPGAGPFSVTGQPNAMGGREVGGLANTLAAHMEFGDDQAYALVSEFWQTDRLAKKPGLRAVELFDAVAEGKIKALWIMATNPVVSLPNADKVKKAIEGCDFVVVSDCIADTDTLRLADVKLPAQGWSEKSGTVTNSERRISRQRKLLPPIADAMPDWWIIAEVGKRMGFGKAFEFASEADVFREHAKLSAYKNSGNRDFNLKSLQDISNIEYDQLLPQQWPCVSPTPENAIRNHRFFAEGNFFTKSGRGQFISVSQRAPQTKLSREYPMVLNTGRIRDQWHTMTRTGLAARLGGHKPEPFLTINPKDAENLQINSGDIVKITSITGQALARADISDTVTRNTVFMPIHWTQVTSSHGRVGAVVTPEFDAISGQPEAKFTPVTISNWVFNSEAVVVTRQELDIDNSNYWVRQTINQGYRYTIASQKTPEELSQYLREIMPNEDQINSLELSDIQGKHFHYARIRVSRLVDYYLVADRLSNRDLDWLTETLTNKVDVTTQRSLISGEAQGSLATGKLICACKNVGLKTIQNSIRENQITCVGAISESTGAGTGCGSCVMELEKILEETLVQN